MKSILVLLALTVSVSAFARDQRGRVELNNGQTIIRIDVGNERDTDSRAMAMRMAKLERAVRELQNRVYDLEDDSRPLTREVKIHICTSTSNFDDRNVGDPALTETEARASALKACAKTRHPMFCEEDNVRCESRIEIQKI